MNRFSSPGAFTSCRRFPAKNRASAGKVPRLDSPLGAKPLSLMGGLLVLLIAAFTACDTGGGIPDVLVTNSFSNGSYIWFDVTLNKSDSLVDFIAVPQGETPDRAAVTARDDEDGPDDTAGRHFRDTLKTGQSHRIVLYNLEKSTAYDVIAFYENEDYSPQDSQVLTRAATTAEVVDLGMVDFTVYEGQKILLPSPLARFSHKVKSDLGESFIWSATLNDSPLNRLFTIFGEDSFVRGTEGSSDPLWKDALSIIFDKTHLSFLRIISVETGHADALYRKHNPAQTTYDEEPNKIKLILGE